MQKSLITKTYNKFFEGDKVLIVSNIYVWGIVDRVWIRNGKITYRVKTNKKYQGELVNKLPEEALLPFIRKWQWRFLGWLKIIK